MFNEFARYEQQFADWRRGGYPGVKPETFEYINFLSSRRRAATARRARTLARMER